MKKAFLGLVFVAATLTACPGSGGAGGPKNIAGSLQLPAGKAFSAAVTLQVGACFIEADKCTDGNPNNKIVNISAKKGDSQVPFSISDLKAGNYFVVLADSTGAIGGYIDNNEQYIAVTPPKTDVKVTIKPSLLQGKMPFQTMSVTP
jgi:hypothetical protein